MSIQSIRMAPRDFAARSSRNAGRALVFFMMSAAISLCSACAGDTGAAPLRDPHALLQSVEFDEHAYNLAAVSPYDTVHLHAVARLADGTVAPVAVKFESTDPALAVDSSGFTTVRTAYSGPIIVYAIATYGGQTLRDVAHVSVVNVPSTLPARIAIPTTDFYNNWILTDTLAKRWGQLSTSFYVQPKVFDTMGAEIAGLESYASSSDSTIIHMGVQWSGSNGSPADFAPAQPGRAWLYMSMYALGKRLRDSIPLIVAEPRLYYVRAEYVKILSGGVRDTLRFFPDSLTIPAGADVLWHSPSVLTTYGSRYVPVPIPGLDSLPTSDSIVGRPVDVHFDTPQYALASHIPPLYGTTEEYYYNNPILGFGFYENEHGGAGDIGTFRYFQFGTGNDPLSSPPCRVVIPVNCTFGAEARSFTRPGKYYYHATQGARGVIVVK